MSNLLGRGDPLERTHSEFIENTLPSYVSIWSKLIGNDGRSNMIVIPGMSNRSGVVIA